ncbi:MAG: hypothetical protein H8E32_05465 [Nitrospinae bacterium]|nr:hypothetical protein [Nitrospinota bacterium]
MRFKIILILSLLSYCIATPGWGKERKSELVLYKDIKDPLTMHMKGRVCKRVLVIQKGKDLTAANKMRDRFCEGEYTLSLDGPPGTTVTIYGQYFFGKKRGYLTLTKTDHQKVWVWNFKSFPDKRWMVSQANEDTGGYESFFQASPGFNMNLGSVKWDEIP